MERSTKVVGYTDTHVYMGDCYKYKVSYNSCGYPFVRINGKTHQVARLIATAYFFTVSSNDRVEFIDNNTKNFRPENLRVVSRSYLSKKAAKGRRFKGRCISHSKLDEVKRLCNAHPLHEVARIFGCSERTIRRYRNVA